VVDFYAGTRLARSELHGELIEDVPEALFERRWIEENRVEGLPHPAAIRRTVVALDPADGTGAGAESALCAACIAATGHVYIIRSEGQRSSPFEYLTHAVRVAEEFAATIVVERNFGGRPLLELLERAMDECGIRRPYQEVWVHQGKRIRAQDMAVLGETGRLHFVGRGHALLEDQLCTWIEGEKSPDRLDAAAHAVNTLLKGYSGRAQATDPERYGGVPYSDAPVPGGAVPWGGASESGWLQEPAWRTAGRGSGGSIRRCSLVPANSPVRIAAVSRVWG
jgi:phage terminase large subunit-like protein